MPESDRQSVNLTIFRMLKIILGVGVILILELEQRVPRVVYLLTRVSAIIGNASLHISITSGMGTYTKCVN